MKLIDYNYQKILYVGNSEWWKIQTLMNVKQTQMLYSKMKRFFKS